jgi:hypothetical protein
MPIDPYHVACKQYEKRNICTKLNLPGEKITTHTSISAWLIDVSTRNHKIAQQNHSKTIGPIQLAVPQPELKF